MARKKDDYLRNFRYHSAYNWLFWQPFDLIEIKEQVKSAVKMTALFVD
ncbi:unnamed protein product [Haemophilus parainfluenzae T3T1]|uniref:Uncharacterized protein n=1 Tax=Haemophilus parainfluenzae (strain T3T1) TaxID=862965 RepID=A0AB33QII2_HAEP3|nr:unnamed protein product [Haemophilus parainfluenzae T3T1]